MSEIKKYIDTSRIPDQSGHIENDHYFLSKEQENNLLETGFKNRMDSFEDNLSDKDVISTLGDLLEELKINPGKRRLDPHHIRFDEHTLYGMWELLKARNYKGIFRDLKNSEYKKYYSEIVKAIWRLKKTLN